MTVDQQTQQQPSLDPFPALTREGPATVSAAAAAGPTPAAVPAAVATTARSKQQLLNGNVMTSKKLVQISDQAYRIALGEKCTVKVGDKIRIIHGPAIMNFASSGGLQPQIIDDDHPAVKDCAWSKSSDHFIQSSTLPETHYIGHEMEQHGSGEMPPLFLDISGDSICAHNRTQDSGYSATSDFEQELRVDVSDEDECRLKQAAPSSDPVANNSRPGSPGSQDSSYSSSSFNSKSPTSLSPVSSGRRGRKKVKLVQYQEASGKELADRVRAALSSIAAPKVSEVGAREATINWVALDCSQVPLRDLAHHILYTLIITEKGQPPRKIPCGSKTNHRAIDLSPATQHEVCVMAVAASDGGAKGSQQGAPSPKAHFSTKALPPDKPSPPVLEKRGKNFLLVKWFSAANGSASSVAHYVLYMCEASSGESVLEEEGGAIGGGGGAGQVVYRGSRQSFKIENLKPSTCYRLKLVAVSESGSSSSSNEVVLSTSSLPPPTPDPPQLLSRAAHSLCLSWEEYVSRNSFSTKPYFSLVMENREKGAGFLPKYHGRECKYTVTGLPSNTPLTFKLTVEEGEQKSKPSDPVTFSTTAACPKPPTGLGVSAVTSTRCTLDWVAPRDDGGDRVTGYIMERSISGGLFHQIYHGTETSLTISTLFPGMEYLFRVASVNSIGKSEWSTSCRACTKPVVPGQCRKPVVSGRPKPHSVLLVWSPPDYDGGSEILEYAVQQIPGKTPDTGHEISRDVRTDLIVFQLTPGTTQWFKVCAINAVGRGPWSPALEVTAPPDKPSAPEAPRVVFKSPTHAHVSWQPPKHDNGSAITEYRLEKCAVHRPAPLALDSEPSTPTYDHHRSGGGGGHGSGIGGGSASSDSSSRARSASGGGSGGHSGYIQIFQGNRTWCEVKNIRPATDYKFRVQAVNGVGNSAWSGETAITSPCSCPDPVTFVTFEADATSISLDWQSPACNGAPITAYNIECVPHGSLSAGGGGGGSSPMLRVSNVNSYTVTGLHADTVYKVRIQAVNVNGSSPFSSVPLKIRTRCLPPDPPALECVGYTASSLRLKWTDVSCTSGGGDGRHSHSSSSMERPRSVTYFLQMEDRSSRFHIQYSGSSLSCKVQRLQEQTTYTFRIYAANEAGAGPYSQLYCFTTAKAAPLPLKAPKLRGVQESSVEVTWAPAVMSSAAIGGGSCSDGGGIVYQLMLASAPHSAAASLSPSGADFTQIYKGEETSFFLDNLSSKVEYRLKVCAIRICEDNQEISGQYSPVISFQTQSIHKLAMTAAAGGGVGGSDSAHFLSNEGRRHAAGTLVLPSFLTRSSKLICEKLSSVAHAVRNFQITDTHIAFAIFIVFVVLAVVLAFYVQNILVN